MSDGVESHVAKVTLDADRHIVMDCGVDTLKSYCVEAAVEIDGMRTQSKLGKTSWWLDWLSDDGTPYLRASVRWGNGLLTDASFDGAFLQVDIDGVAPDGTLVPYATRRLGKDVNMAKGVNLLAADYSAGQLKIYVGSDIPREVAVIKDVKLPSAFSLSGNRRMEVAYFSGRFIPAMRLPVIAMDSIIVEVSACKDGMAGFWRFLDRDTDGRRSELGGLYTLALLPHNARIDVAGNSLVSLSSGQTPVYDIYYIDGAKVNGPDWIPGMLKGRLYATPFQHHYRLQWYDSQKMDMGDECFADAADDRLLTLQFPLFGAKVRFAREDYTPHP